MPGSVPGRASILVAAESGTSVDLAVCDLDRDVAKIVQRKLLEHFGHSTLTAGAVAEAAVQEFVEFWCEADFAGSMAPEWVAAAMDVQRMLRERYGRAGLSAGVAAEVAVQESVEDSCAWGSSRLVKAYQGLPRFAKGCASSAPNPSDPIL